VAVRPETAVAPGEIVYLDSLSRLPAVDGSQLTGVVSVPGPHAATHRHGGGDEVATATPGANEIPKASGAGTLSPGWLPAATETAQGAAEIATQIETDTGTDDTRIVTALKLATTPRLPTQSENDALQGTNGVPSNANRYVTDSDPRNTNARTPTSHASTHQHGGGDEVATATPAANAIPKAGGAGTLDQGWVPAATETVRGSAEVATQAETDTGTDDARIVTPLKLRTNVRSIVRPQTRTDDFGVHSFGPFSDYTGLQGSPQAANEIQYMRVWLRAGITITSMRTFITGGADGVRQIQFAIYDQVTPTSDSQGPNNRVATTAADTPPGAFTGVRTVALTAPYAVTTTGWYHLAIQVSSGAVVFLMSVTHRAGTIPRREETPGGFTLPATAGVTTQPQSAALYCAAVE